ncbi:unnamed protein product [marine sediment metagenome]|uniref:Uncharacterized protein n=1 Tax=marine sediment metagenome TaxID=412755 RepID=X1RWZ5_9ZZZZ
MNKEIILSLINALKTLKNIMINHKKTFRDLQDVRSMFIMNRILYQGERFKKITEDINLLMKKALRQKDFESYLENSNKMLRDLLKREEYLNEQVKKAIGDFAEFCRDTILHDSNQYNAFSDMYEPLNPDMNIEIDVANPVNITI